MGYELVVHYKEEVEKGVYSEEEKTKTIKVGTPTEDTPLVLVAGKIFAQLARRNILVVDVEIFEFTKKKLGYKQTDDGILIKNKKFRFDDEIGPSVSVEHTSAVESDDGEALVSRLLDLLTSHPELAAKFGGGGRQPSQTGVPLATPPQSPPPYAPHEKIATVRERPLRNEIFEPPPWLLKEARKRGLKFTVGKQYPILKEKMAENPSAGIIYTTINDGGERQSLTAIHFNPVPVKLEGNFIEGPIETAGPQANLSWDGVIDDSVPNLR